MIVQSMKRETWTAFRAVARALGLAAVLVLPAPTAHAGSDRRLGTSGAPELVIPVGPRGTALGQSVASDITGAEAVYWNPAGLASLTGTEALFSHTQYFADMKVNFVSVVARAGNLGAVGFAAKVLSVGDVIVTTEQAPEGTGEIINPTFSVLGVSWGRAFTDRINFGFTANYVSEHVETMNASGLALDFGVQYQTGWRAMNVAMIVKNIGSSMNYSGSGLDISVQPPGFEPGASNRIVSFTTSDFEMPSYFALSAGYDAYHQGVNVVQLKASFANNNFGGDNVGGALEWTYQKYYSLRGSWFGTLTSTTDVATGEGSSTFDSGDDVYNGFALGGGVRLRSGDTQRLAVDLTWRPARSPFDDVVEVGLSLAF